MYVIFLYLFILQTHSKDYLRQPKIINLNAYNYAYTLKHRTIFRKIVLKSISFTYTLSLCPLFFQKCFLYFIGFFLVIRDRVMSLVRFSVIQNLHRKSNPLASTRPISIGSCLLLCNFFKITFNKKLRIQKLLKYQSRELNLLRKYRFLFPTFAYFGWKILFPYFNSACYVSTKIDVRKSTQNSSVDGSALVSQLHLVLLRCFPEPPSLNRDVKFLERVSGHLLLNFQVFVALVFDPYCSSPAFFFSFIFLLFCFSIFLKKLPLCPYFKSNPYALQKIGKVLIRKQKTLKSPIVLPPI